jgi:glycosyltransferase involved in cell wall biosynthesis
MGKTLIIYSPGVFSRYGHAFDYVQGLGVALSKQDVEVHVLGLDGPLSLPEGICEHRVLATSNLNRTDYRRFGFAGDIIWGMSRMWRQRKLSGEILRLHRCLPTSSVLFETFEYVDLARLLSKISWQDKCFCIFHDTNFNIRHTSIIAALYKRAMRSYARNILKSITTAYVHGQEMSNNLTESLGIAHKQELVGKIHVIPYGAPHPDDVEMVDRQIARSTLGLPQDKKILLAFGTLRRDKNFDVVLRALKNVPDWLFLVAGPEGDYTYTALLSLAKEHNVSDRVQFFNEFIPPERHTLYFGAADVVVNIYNSNVRHESGTAQKARTFLKPVLGGGTPDLGKYISSQGVGWYADPLIPETITSLLNMIAQFDDSDWLIIQERIYQCAVARSWKSISKIILEENLK